MTKLKYFRRSTVRLALVYIIIFSTSVIALLGYIYWSTAAYMLKQNDITIGLEIRGLAEHYHTNGLKGLSQSIQKRLSNPTGSSIYLLTDNKFKPLLGNLSGWPDTTPDKDGWLNIKINFMEQNAQQAHQVRARTFNLIGGFKLLVGRDIYLLKQTEKLIVQSLIWGLLLTLLIAGIGGGMVSHSMLRRIEEINSTSQEIMSGDLSKRIPTLKNNDEFDDLANNLNKMLDRIQILVNDVQHLSDNIAHDLRTPLTRLQHHLDSLQNHFHSENPSHSEERSNLLELAISEADNLLKTFNALLHVAAIENATIKDEFYAMSIKQILMDVIELYAPLIEEKNQQLQVEINSSAMIKGNRELLSQAFANLIDNAIKYTPEEGQIRIHLSNNKSSNNKSSNKKSVDKLIELEISDTGPGIPEQEQEKVFQRFYRVDKSRFSKGNGLGLSLVQAVFKLHQISIRLNNKSSGLSVICLLPITINEENKKNIHAIEAFSSTS